MNNGRKGGVYIHVPFCLRKCPYCDFYSVSDLSPVSGYVSALLAEMEMRAPTFPFPCDTLYFGGGTPSILPPDDIAQIIASAKKLFQIPPDAEITLEANPGTLTRDRMAELSRIGISRMNIGIQSFSPDRLAFLGRIHTEKEAVNAVEWARRAGMENLGIDLIYGLPDQSRASWRRELKTGLSLAPEHFSCYSLTAEKGTPLGTLVEEGKIRLPGGEEVAALFDETIDTLGASGYVHYEISNFARSERFRSRHNQKYWDGTPYLGLGPGAHSFLPPVRQWNASDLNGYIRALSDGELPPGEEEVLSREQRMTEAVMAGLRTDRGISSAAFEKRFGVRLETLVSWELKRLKAEGMLMDRADRVSLTRKGMHFLNDIVEGLVTALPSEPEGIRTETD